MDVAEALARQEAAGAGQHRTVSRRPGAGHP
jgi:hypothetical protein